MNRLLRFSAASTASQREANVWLPFTIAVVAPCMLVLNIAPTPEVFTELAVLALWGWLVTVLARSLPVLRGGASPIRSAAPLLLALGVVGAGVILSCLRQTLPVGITAAAMLFLTAAAVAALSGARTATSSALPSALNALFIALTVLGALNVIISFTQFFFPQWATNWPIAEALVPGRAIGNVRQPNHLATLLCWSLIAVVALVESGGLRRSIAVPLYFLLVSSVVLSASRTGVVELIVLVCWGLLDRRLSRATRAMLIATPLIYLGSWFVTQWWAEHANLIFTAADRLQQPDDSGKARLIMWRSAWALISKEPWLGVGYGAFNFAQLLSSAGESTGELPDNVHNLPLHLATELGVPAAALIMGLLIYSMVRAWKNTAASCATATSARAAYMLLLPVAIHSQLEFPLWYAYFLLPTAWVWGLTLALPSAPTPAGRPARQWPHVLAGALLSLAALVGLADYLKVVQMYDGGPDSAPLYGRIVVGQQSYFFGHHADYAAATSSTQPWLLEGGFDRALHNRLDQRLLQAWATTLHEQGQEEQAKFVAARLREMNRPGMDESFFADCDRATGHPIPFQCQASTTAFEWRSFLSRRQSD